MGERGEVAVAVAVDLDQRHPLPLAGHTGALQRVVVKRGQILVGREPALGQRRGAADAGSGALLVAGVGVVGRELRGRMGEVSGGHGRGPVTEQGPRVEPDHAGDRPSQGRGHARRLSGGHEARHCARLVASQRGAEHPLGDVDGHRRVGEQAGAVDPDRAGAGAVQEADHPRAIGGGGAEAAGQDGDRLVLAVDRRADRRNGGGEALQPREVGVQREHQ